MYRNGHGVPQHYKEAARWFRKAAEQGSVRAQNSLASMYRFGHGVVQDLVMAYVWLNVSAANGVRLVKESRDSVLARLSASERKLGRKLSKLCLKKPAKCPEYSDD